MNLSKTQATINEHKAPGLISVNGGALMVVQEYVYLEQTLQPHTNNNFEREINR